MATNYSFKQFVNNVLDGADVETLMDMGRRYPCLLAAVSEAKAVASDQVRTIANAIPDFVTARKVEKGLQNPGEETEDATDEEPDAEPEVEEKPAPKKRGRKPAKKAEPEPEPEAEAEDDDTEDGGKYAGKNAMTLFKECKKRGIKAAPKKPAKFYIELLEADDAKADSAEDEDDEDWDI